MPKWDKERRERVRELNREVTMFAVGHVMDELRAKYRDFADITAHLDAVEKDLIEHVDAFLATPAERPPAPAEGAPAHLADGDRFRRYQVNVLVDSSAVVGAPVVYEDNPTYMNLVGAVEHLAEMGTLVTDFGLIRSGALHRANGGYLLLDAHKLLMQPFAWEALKRALRSKEIRIETPAQMMNLVSTVTLTPQPVPLDVKVVLVAERWLYYLLSQNDFEFHELFKVAVDFEDDMQWNAEATSHLCPFDRHDGEARGIEATGSRRGRAGNRTQRSARRRLREAVDADRRARGRAARGGLLGRARPAAPPSMPRTSSWRSTPGASAATACANARRK